MVDNYSYPLQPTSQNNLGFNQTNATGTNSSFNIGSFMQPFPLQDQKQELGDYRTRFSGFLGGQETPEQTRDRLANRYGYNDLSEQYQQSSEAMGQVGAQIKAAPANIQERVNRSGTITTQGQLAGIQNKEVAELVDTYTSLGQINEQQGRRLASIEANMNAASQLEMAQQQKMSQPWLMEYQDTNVLQARQQTNWTFASQTELSRLLANMNAGMTLSEADKNRAQELSMQENSFKSALDQITAGGEQSRLTKRAPTDLASLWSSFMGG